MKLKMKTTLIIVSIVGTNCFAGIVGASYSGNKEDRSLFSVKDYVNGYSQTYTTDTDAPVSLIAGLGLYKNGVFVDDHEKQTIGEKSTNDILDPNKHPKSESYVMYTRHNFWWGDNDKRNEYRPGITSW